MNTNAPRRARRTPWRRVNSRGARELLTTSGHVVRGGIMLVFFIAGTIAGILLGLRFKVFALIPATLLAAGVVIVTDGELRVVALNVFGTAVLLQIGYFVGCVVRFYARGTNRGTQLNRPGRDRQH